MCHSKLHTTNSPRSGATKTLDYIPSCNVGGTGHLHTVHTQYIHKIGYPISNVVQGCTTTRFGPRAGILTHRGSRRTMSHRLSQPGSSESDIVCTGERLGMVMTRVAPDQNFPAVPRDSIPHGGHFPVNVLLAARICTGARSDNINRVEWLNYDKFIIKQ